MLLTLHKHGYWNVSFLPWKCITYVAVCPVTHSSRHSLHLKITSAGLCAASCGALRRQPSRPLYTLCCRHYFLPSNKSMFALSTPSWRLCLLRCGFQTMKIQMWSTGRGARGRCKGLGMRWGGGSTTFLISTVTARSWRDTGSQSRERFYCPLCPERRDSGPPTGFFPTPRPAGTAAPRC